MIRFEKKLNNKNTEKLELVRAMRDALVYIVHRKYPILAMVIVTIAQRECWRDDPECSDLNGNNGEWTNGDDYPSGRSVCSSDNDPVLCGDLSDNPSLKVDDDLYIVYSPSASAVSGDGDDLTVFSEVNPIHSDEGSIAKWRKVFGVAKVHMEVGEDKESEWSSLADVTVPSVSSSLAQKYNEMVSRKPGKPDTDDVVNPLKDISKKLVSSGPVDVKPIARGHQQGGRLDNFLNQGGKSRGGNKFGPPPGVKYVHPDNKNNHPDPPKKVRKKKNKKSKKSPPGGSSGSSSPPSPSGGGGGGPLDDGSLLTGDEAEKPDLKFLSQHQFHENEKTSAVSGSLRVRVADEHDLDSDLVRMAGAKAGAYNVGRVREEFNMMPTKRATFQLETVDMTARERSLARVRTDEKLDEEAIVNYAKDERETRTIVNRDERMEPVVERQLRRDVRRREVMHAKSMEEMSIKSRTVLQVQMAEENFIRRHNLARKQGELQMHIELMLDPIIQALSDQKVAEETAQLQRQEADLIAAANIRYKIKQVEEGGIEKNKHAYKDPVRFVRNPRYVQGGDPIYNNAMPMLNDKRLDDPAYISCVDRRLVPGLLFRRHDKISFWNWIANGFLGSWKKTVSQVGYDSVRRNVNISPELGMEIFRDTNNFIGMKDLLKNEDRRMCVSILSNYRFFGFESDLVRELLNGDMGYVRKNGFTHVLPVMVHPTLYQEVYQKAIGCSMTFNQSSLLVREHVKIWEERIQMALFNDTVALACQHADIMNEQRRAAIGKETPVVPDRKT